MLGPGKIFGSVTAVVKVRFVLLLASLIFVSAAAGVVVEGGWVDVPLEGEWTVVDVVEKLDQDEVVWDTVWSLVVAELGLSRKEGYQIQSPWASRLHSPPPPSWSIVVVAMSDVVGTVFELVVGSEEVRVRGASMKDGYQIQSPSASRLHSPPPLSRSISVVVVVWDVGTVFKLVLDSAKVRFRGADVVPEVWNPDEVVV